MNTLTPSRPEAGTLGIEQLAVDPLEQWSAACRRFLDWQRREILGGDPSAEDLQRHRTALKWLLRFGRAVYAIAADPEYPSPEVAAELHGRLIQLERSWQMVQQPMPEAEPDALLREVFPECDRSGRDALQGLSQSSPPWASPRAKTTAAAVRSNPAGLPDGSRRSPGAEGGDLREPAPKRPRTPEGCQRQPRTAAPPRALRPPLQRVPGSSPN